jgi:hypothetical protein
MAGTLRLRQVCLVACDLEPHAKNIKDVFGLEECYRDPNVARYGLANVVLPIGTDFIEIVSPTRPDTAAGRFLERNGERGGYMIILDCDDPLARQAHCHALGVRTANLIRHDTYVGVQLHPKDTGGTMLEFNRTENGEDAMGPYAPAGAGWQNAIRQDVTRRLIAAEIDCPDPAAFAERWGEILQRPVVPLPDRARQIRLDSGVINFLRSAQSEPMFAGVELQVADRATVVSKAKRAGCIAEDGDFRIGGIRVRLTDGTP